VNTDRGLSVGEADPGSPGGDPGGELSEDNEQIRTTGVGKVQAAAEPMSFSFANVIRGVLGVVLAVTFLAWARRGSSPWF
jgi:hypothetical protein